MYNTKTQKTISLAAARLLRLWFEQRHVIDKPEFVKTRLLMPENAILCNRNAYEDAIAELCHYSLLPGYDVYSKDEQTKFMVEDQQFLLAVSALNRLDERLPHLYIGP
jgi:hypothetical protein